MVFCYVIAQVEAWQEVVFLYILFSFRAPSVYVIGYVHVNVVVLEAEIGGELLCKLVCAFGVCRVDVFLYVVCVYVAFEREVTVGIVFLVVIVVETHVVDVESGLSCYRHVVIHGLETVVDEASHVA